MSQPELIHSNDAILPTRRRPKDDGDRGGIHVVPTKRRSAPRKDSAEQVVIDANMTPVFGTIKVSSTGSGGKRFFMGGKVVPNTRKSGGWTTPDFVFRCSVNLHADRHTFKKEVEESRQKFRGTRYGVIQFRAREWDAAWNAMNPLDREVIFRNCAIVREGPRVKLYTNTLSK